MSRKEKKKHTAIELSPENQDCSKVDLKQVERLMASAREVSQIFNLGVKY